MKRLAWLPLVVFLCACAYSGHELREAGAGGTAPAGEAEPERQDRRFEEPIRPGRSVR